MYVCTWGLGWLCMSCFQRVFFVCVFKSAGYGFRPLFPAAVWL